MSDEKKKMISVSTGCFNEKDNIPEFYERIKKIFEQHPQYDWEMVISDNCSTDGTRELLRDIAAKDKRVRVILNSRNFGQLRSPYNSILHTRGDAVFILVSDLQEPPEMLHEFIKKWEEGYKVVCGVRSGTKENFLMAALRGIYYRLLSFFSDEIKVVRYYTGFGLYDRQAIDALKSFHEPYPYLRGILSEVGFSRIEIPFVQERRKAGRTKNNFFSLYDVAMTGFVNHTKFPLRMAVFFGFITAFISFLIALGYLIVKLIYWDSFSFGFAPLMIGLFFFASIQLIFIGIIGEYVGAIWTQVKDRPLVIEEERINFDEESKE
ncbi:MAG: glycosyltransferase family 2 protein [Planctomycetia bacterium]|nr:glycosyltransferase family 2 protein [Planctomycetia bacterium]